MEEKEVRQNHDIVLADTKAVVKVEESSDSEDSEL